MGASTIELIGSVIGVLAVVFAAGRFAENLKANTKVTEKLTTVIDGHLSWAATRDREFTERFHDHDTRITILEQRDGE